MADSEVKEDEDLLDARTIRQMDNPALQMYKPWLQEVLGRSPPLDLDQDAPDELLIATLAANHQRRTFGRLPRQAGDAFRSAVIPALQTMAGALVAKDDKLFTQALRCLLIVPQFALVKSNQTISAMDLLGQIHRFCDGPRPNHAEPAHDPEDPPSQNQEHQEGKNEQPSDLTPDQLRALKRAKWMASEGRFSKAAQAVQQAANGQSGVLDPSDDVIKKLRSLHPEATRTPPPCPDEAPLALPIVNSKLLRAGNRISNGSAPDIFGWTGELVRFLLHDRLCCAHVSKLVQAIRDGQVCDDARHWLLLSWLIAVDKGNDKIRPIAGGTMFVKLTATYLMETMEQAKNVFRGSGVQCGVFMPDGATVARNFTQLALETDPDNVVVKVDFKNAFNTLSRFGMLSHFFKEPQLLPVYRLASWIYGQPSSLLVRDRQGRAVATIPSEQGVRQGCVLGSLLFASATMFMLTELKDQFAGVEVLAYLDDVILVGKYDRCLAALDQLINDAADMKLEVQPDKCEVLIPTSLEPEAQKILFDKELCLVRGALPLLGSVVGTEHNDLRHWAKGEIDSWKKTLQMMARKELPVQLSLLLTRWTITAKPNSLARTLPPQITQDLLDDLDRTVIRAVEDRTRLRFEDFARTLLELPIRHGGVGFCPSAETAPHAYVAGMAASFSGFFGYSNLWKSSTWDKVRETPSLQCLDATLKKFYTSPNVKFVGKRDMGNVDDFAKHFTFNSKRSHKLQARIMSAFREERVTRIDKDIGLNPKDRAHWKSRLNKHSAAPWRAYPLTKEFLLSDEDATFMLQYATGTPTPGLPQQCSCHRSLDLEHAVHCDTAKLQRHNLLQHRLVAFAREQHVTTKQNERFSIEHAQKKLEPDIVFYFGTDTLETDVTVVNPCAPSRLMQTLSKPGSALAFRCREKNKKYLVSAQSRGHSFAPLGFETHGRFDQPLIDLLAKFASNTPDHVGYAVADMALDLSLTLVRGNALCARRTFARALRFRDQTRSVAA